MKDDPVLYGLLARRAAMAGEIDALREQLGVLLSGLDHVDATIRIFKPDIDLEDLPSRPIPPPSAAFRGEVQRFLLHTLRNAPEPMNTHQLAVAIMEQRRLNTADRVLFKLISQRTGHSLSKLRRAGLVQSERFSTGALLRWQVKRETLNE
ncbi:hypothetical protein KX816_14670 [Sphingosinicellaceae bacterium]|nr:hypothetical protein KX816_14670 [Sphingosinicellaceae bacterium]